MSKHAQICKGAYSPICCCTRAACIPKRQAPLFNLQRDFTAGTMDILKQRRSTAATKLQACKLERMAQATIKASCGS